MSWYPIDVGVKTPQNALNQNRAEQHAPVTPIRDANITPHANARPTAASAPRSLVMEAPPQWRECDRRIYCRVNVAKPLIAGLAGLAARCAGSICCAGLMREKRFPRPPIAHLEIIKQNFAMRCRSAFRLLHRNINALSAP